MIPPTPSLTVPPDASAETLLQLGKPFVQFPRFSILNIQRDQDHLGNPLPFSQWLQNRLHAGLPFVIADFDKLESWPNGNPKDGREPGFGIERLIELSTKKNIPIRNCSTGRDLSFTLRKFADSARQSFQEFQNLYARDLPCPQEWLEECSQLLPTELQWSGRLDLFQWLPPCARSEVMMAYVGSEGSSSGFHRCFSSTVALNFLVESDDRPVVCIGTDFDSQKKYDAFISAKGISPHLDWYNLNTDEMQKADFPIYAYDQRVGDLVVFPPATAHQVWNPSTLSTKMVWNILHPLSLEVGFQNVQPSFNRLCHPDLARTNLSLACAMMSLLRDNQTSTPMPLPPDLPLLSRLFRQMVHDETIDSLPVTPIALITLPDTVIATCNFCSTAIWNRHVRCTQCSDFDLCLLCYLNGRSCEHTMSYAWAEIVPRETCTQVLTRAREIMGFQPEPPAEADLQNTLGTAVNDLMRAKASQVSRLCHLCRIDHPEWRGKRCDKCTAFFCYRGLFRHFDMNPSDILRHKGQWTCPKCSEICNCRCCHFSTAYTKSEKPASKRRVKASDSRGKTMGFADNVFDQKRGRRESGHSNQGNGNGSGRILPGVSSIVGKKRPLAAITAPSTPLRKIELPTPEPDYSSSMTRSFVREGSDLYADLSYGNSVNGSVSRGNTLPGVKSIAEASRLMISPPDDRGSHSRISMSPGLSLTPSTTIGINTSNTLPPILGKTSPLTQHPPYYQTTNGIHSSTSLPPSLKSPNSATHLLTSTSTSPTTNAPLTLLPSLNPSQSHLQNLDSAPSIPSTLDATIQTLESQIHHLRAYEDEFIALGLDDSRRLLQRQLAELEGRVKDRRRERGLRLVEKLRGEGLLELAGVVGREVGVGSGDGGGGGEMKMG